MVTSSLIRPMFHKVWLLCHLDRTITGTQDLILSLYKFQMIDIRNMNFTLIIVHILRAKYLLLFKTYLRKSVIRDHHPSDYKSAGLSLWMISVVIQKISDFPLLRLVKNKYFPSSETLGHISQDTELTQGPILTAGIQVLSFLR